MDVIYRTYFNGEFNKGYIDRIGLVSGSEISLMNKPRGGLWGCRGTEWLDWCNAEHFRSYDSYYTWKLTKDAKLFYIDSIEDIVKLFSYRSPIPNTTGLLSSLPDSIDWSKVQKDYDAVEISPHIAYNYRTIPESILGMNNWFGFSAWDVPSVCVMTKGKVELIGVVKERMENETKKTRRSISSESANLCTR